MSQFTRKICINYKQHLLSADSKVYINAIGSLKECLTLGRDESFIKTLIDFDIHEFLLQRLSSNYSVNITILKCIEQLCTYKIFFSYDHAVNTAETILKSIFYHTNNSNHDDFLQLALNVISIIIKNLSNFYSVKTLIFTRYIETVEALLLSKHKGPTLCATINVISELLLYNLFQKYVNSNDNLINDIYKIWQLSLTTLSNIYQNDANESIFSLSKLCHHMLRFNKALSVYENNNIIDFSSKIIEDCTNIVKFVCIPFIKEFGFQVNNIYVEYLYFLHTLLLHSDLKKNDVQLICNCLVNDMNFTFIVKYMDCCGAFFKKLDDFNIFKQLYIELICEIILNFNENNDDHYIDERNKIYFLKNLQTVIQDYKKWFSLLLNPNIDVNIKLSIIKVCCLCYVHSNTIDYLQKEDFKAIIIFIKELIFPNIDVYFLKDLWLILAYMHCLFFNEKSCGYILFKAILNLQKLLIINERSFDKIISSHACILDWTFSVPHTQEILRYAVLCYWIKNLHQLDYKILFDALRRIPEIGCTLLGIIKYGTPHISEISSEILSKILKEGYLMDHQRFREKLSLLIPYFVTDLSRKHLIEEIVVRSIYMFHLASYNKITINIDLLEYSASTFTKCVGKLGISEIFPSLFYTTAFSYVVGILDYAKINRIYTVFNLFICTESMLQTFMSALHSEKEELSDKASDIFNILLEYQQDLNICVHQFSVVFKIKTLKKIVSVPKNNQLEVNLQITQKLLRTTPGSILNTIHPLNDKFLRSLYVRCLCLILKPENLQLTKYGLKCMKDILKYSYKYQLECHNYFWNYPGNLNVIMIFSEKNIPSSIEKDLLSYINCLLRYAIQNKSIIFNHFITFKIWKLTLTQILHLINNNYEQTENYNLIVNICQQLMFFSDLLPLPLKVALENCVKNM